MQNNEELQNDSNEKINKLANNPEIKSLIKKIIDKIEIQKKYKKNSIEMLKELQNNLKEIVLKSKNTSEN